MKLFFYKKTTQPKDYAYFNHTKGIVGYEYEINAPCIFEGTVSELEESHLKEDGLMIKHRTRFRTFARG